MEEIVGIMHASIEQGLQGTQYTDRILGNQLPTSISKWQAEGLWVQMS